MEVELKMINLSYDIDRLELLIGKVMPEEEVRAWIRANRKPFGDLMVYYECAMKEVETRCRIISDGLSLIYDHNPIESIQTRIKTTESMIEKLQRRGFPFSLDSIEKNIFDVAGVRVVCSFPSDIYMLADAFLKQDDVHLIARKDYIETPKPNGYRSLHLIVELPIYLHDRKKLMKVEVQFRTISMDWWAGLEHKIKYKKNIPADVAAELGDRLLRCAEISARLDHEMELVSRKAALYTNDYQPYPEEDSDKEDKTE